MIAVVLSTFNGARFLPAQLDSIAGQSITDWTLHIRDDGSSDDTANLCGARAAGERRITVVPADGARLGPVLSYGRLLDAALRSGARYVFPADQDDVWDRDKMAIQLQAMREREAVVGPTVPILVHSDLRVAEADGVIVHESFMRYQRIAHAATNPLAVLIAQNFVTACATLVNHRLLELALPFPRSVVMHDWWLALVAAAAGEIVFVPRATLAYRQHEANAIGARGLGRMWRIVFRDGRTWWRDGFSNLLHAIEQCRSLEARLAERGVRVPALVTRYGEVFAKSLSAVQRVRGVRALGIAPQSIPRRLLYYARVALASRAPRQARGA